MLLAEGNFTDPENARIIYLMAAGLVLVAALVAAGTVWWWRSAKAEHPALGPLEVMGTRRWWRSDYSERRRRLEAARAAGAEPLVPPVPSGVEEVDLTAIESAEPPDFEDLSDEALRPELPAELVDDSEADAGVQVEAADVEAEVQADAEVEAVAEAEAVNESVGDPLLVLRAPVAVTAASTLAETDAVAPAAEGAATVDTAGEPEPTPIGRPIDPLLRAKLRD